MGKPKAPSPVQSLVINGARWDVYKLTPALNKKFLQYLDNADPDVTLRGFCDNSEKKIYIRPGLHPEDTVNTVLHELIHAIVTEIGYECGIWKLNGDERAVSRITAELLSVLKQSGVIPAEE